MTTKAFKSILIYGRKPAKIIRDNIKMVTDLLTELNIDWFIEPETANIHQLASKPQNDTAEDLVIVIGGDGSILQAAQYATKKSLAILGIGYGRVGFLTDHYDLNQPTFRQILLGDYSTESRLMFDLWYKHHDQIKPIGTCVNEVCLSRQPQQHMLETELYVDNKPICHFHGDGIIVSTPSGSTAYALSAGGPIVCPDIDAMIIVPICPHKLSSRPIIVSATSQIELQISHFHQQSANLAFDTQMPLSIDKHQRLMVKASKQRLTLIHPPQHSFYETLKTKLSWEHRFHAEHH